MTAWLRRPIGPLDFARMLAFLRKRSLPGIELIGEDSYQRVLGTPERPTLLRVTADPKRPERLQLGAVDPRLIPDIAPRASRIRSGCRPSRSTPRWPKNRCWRAASPNGPGCACPAAGMASRWCACRARPAGQRPRPPPSRGAWSMPTAHLPGMPRHSIASSRHLRCWPKHRWNRSAAPQPRGHRARTGRGLRQRPARLRAWPGRGGVRCALRCTARHRPVDRALHRPARARPARCVPGRRSCTAAGPRPRAGPA